MQEAIRTQSLDGDNDLAEQVVDEGELDDLNRSILNMDFRKLGNIPPEVKAKRRSKNRQARKSRKANRR